jgi:uncharacterized protein DUF4157
MRVGRASPPSRNHAKMAAMSRGAGYSNCDMPDVLTDDELRQAFLERGPAWIRAQASAHGARAAAVPPEVAAGFRPFFGADVDRARVVAAEMSNPPFYAELRARGVDARDLLSFADGMAAITFDTTIVVAPQATEAAPAKFTELIFHELVHVVQYRLLGVDRFAQLYVDGWMAGRARYRDNPAQRYMNILLEHMAFQLQGRYAAAPTEAFSVEDAVRSQLGLSAEPARG